MESGAMAGKLETCRCVHGKESKIERGKKIGQRKKGRGIGAPPGGLLGVSGMSKRWQR
jgi:hypothetical protein